MLLLSSMTACNPCVPINAADGLTLRSPRSMVLEVQADKLPDSNPSAKIKCATLGVLVMVGVDVAVEVSVFLAHGTGGVCTGSISERVLLFSLLSANMPVESTIAVTGLL